MAKRCSPGSGSTVVEGLDVHLAQFLATLAAAGYAEKTQHDKRRLIVPFVRWAQDARLAVADLNEACIAAFLARPSRRRWKCREPERAALRPFLEHLRSVGVAPPLFPSEPAPSEVLVRRYLGHLPSDRGLCARSVDVYSPFVRAFVAAQRLPEHIACLDARRRSGPGRARRPRHGRRGRRRPGRA